MAEEPKKLKKKKIGSLSSLEVEAAIPRTHFEPDEWYLGKLESVEEKEGNYGPYLNFKFTVLDGQMEDGTDAKGKTISRLMDKVLAPGKPLMEWAAAMSGKKELAVGDKFNLTSHYGEKFRILISDRKKKKGAADGERWQQVNSIKKPKPKAEAE